MASNQGFEGAMRNRSPARSLRIRSKCIVLLLVLSGWLASCSDNGPVVSAQAWYTAFHALDAQTVIGLTCSSRLEEAQLRLQQHSETLAPSGTHSADLSGLQFQTVDPGRESAIVQVTGTEIVHLDQQSLSREVKKGWQFIREGGLWKWCGEVPYIEEGSLLSNLPLGVMVVAAALAAVIILVFLSSRRRDYSPFYAKTENGVVRQIKDYEAGRIRSFSKVKGYGFISDDRGKTYSIDYASFIDQAYHDLTNGERVLFQSEWTERGPRACNVIRVDNQPPSTNPHSRKLIILAERVKKMRQDFRFYKVTHIQRELNTCKSFFELLDHDVKRYNIKLETHEVILLYEVEKDLRDISDEIESMSDDNRWWVRIVALIVQILDVVADIVQNISPQAAELLRSLGRSTGHLLDRKKQPLLGPGKKKHDE